MASSDAVVEGLRSARAVRLPGVLRRVLSPAAPFYAVATITVAIAFVHTLLEADSLVTDLVEGLVPVLLATVPVYAGYEFARLEPDARTVRWGTVILVGGGLFGMAIAGFVGWVRALEGAPIGEFHYVVFVAMAAGGALSTPIAYGYASLRNRLVELETQHRESARLRRQLSIINRVLRHNIRNELSVLYGATDLLAAADPGADDSQGAVLARKHLDRIDDLSQTAVRLNHVWDSDVRTTADAVAVLDDELVALRERAPDLSIVTDVPERAPVLVNTQFATAIEEVFANVVEHNDPATSTLSVTVRIAEETTRIDIRDDGVGIPDIEIEALASDQETALIHTASLGLWVVYWIVQQSGGDLVVDRPPVGGTLVRITVPSAPAT